jgi:feruloyl esterase
MIQHRRPFLLGALFALVLMTPFRFRVEAAPVSCASISALQLKNGAVTLAEEVGQGAFTPAGVGFVAPAAADFYAAAPAFCRVVATAAPTSGSAITIEVWLPKNGWNGKLQAVGNGGWAGTIPYTSLASALSSGYAAAATDTGHSTAGASFAMDQPEKLADYAHRSLHELAVHAKIVVSAYYGAAPKTALWNGCSTGGNQGLTLASKYPEDFDAIIAGAPPDPRARLMSVRLLINRLVHRSAGSYIPPEKYAAIHRAVLEACDVRDGAKDGVIENPRACAFDPAVLACTDADGPSCLTPPQIETAKLLYSDVKHPKTGETLYPPLLVPGSELAWATLAGPEPFPNAVDAYRHLAHRNPDWDPRAFDMATDIELMDRAAAPLNTVAPDLRPFFKRGGKLLMYHGWNDRQVPAMSSVTYFERVLAAAGRESAGPSIQLYMVPGMDHCRAGAGTDTFDKVTVMEQWLSTGRAPSSIIASRSVDGKIVRTRPLCPYPQIARYNGSGSVEDAANFTCSVNHR